MKTSIFFLLQIIAMLTGNAQSDSTQLQTDSVEVKVIGLPDSSDIGVPNGKQVRQEISVSGGTIISDDGRVQLNFPPGALTETTTISIQPVNNKIPNGNKAYRFEPSGLQFQKPV